MGQGLLRGIGCSPSARVAMAGYALSFYPAVVRSGVAVATVIALGAAPVFAGLAHPAGQTDLSLGQRHHGSGHRLCRPGPGS